MPDDTIYMTPLPENTGIILMDPLPEYSGVIYMDPIQTEEAEWELIGTFTWSASTASTTWNESPGSYGITQIVVSNKSLVRIVGVSGYYNDNVPAGNIFLGTLGFKTAGDFSTCGPGGSLESNYITFTTQAEAEFVWAGASTVLFLGDDGIISYGMHDTDPTNNAGALTFKVYAI
jgi:hypothetical protein